MTTIQGWRIWLHVKDYKQHLSDNAYVVKDMDRSKKPTGTIDCTVLADYGFTQNRYIDPATDPVGVQNISGDTWFGKPAYFSLQLWDDHFP